MDTEKAFNELGVSAIIGVKLLEAFNMSPEDFVIPARFAKFQSVVAFLKQYPEDTQRFLITKGTRRSAGDKLDYFFDYANILKEKTIAQQLLEQVNKELELMEAVGDPIKFGEVKAKQGDLQEKIYRLSEEQTLWE